ncbi:uncharacterized protein LOC106177393 [Lingula anatina]|uniref:Uncharacterized protein LOC106177393 n=1 Tax=Lingula anatina TaxID=7574 RepID=A0A1S3JYY9_LINAN|nr:uncharacterized protein LOC106177393 [Lingula anatina]|eukprot:XP_013415603.1 uncharacterized protein LOC106177393 [Lingula anatina]
MGYKTTGVCVLATMRRRLLLRLEVKGKDAVKLRWGAPSGLTTGTYTIYYRRVTETAFHVVSGVQGNSYTVQGLHSYAKYEFKVKDSHHCSKLKKIRTASKFAN